MNARSVALQVERVAQVACLYMSLELGAGSWLLSFSAGGQRHTSRSVEAGDVGALLAAIAWAKARLHLAAQCAVLSCYEAGREGFWLHRYLQSQGVNNVVVDSSSIEVNRRLRRAKTDRIDGMKLLELLVAYAGGDRGRMSVVRVPSEAEEDRRRLHREREALMKEALRHRNRICSLLALHGIRAKAVGGRGWRKRLEALVLGQRLKQELERETERLELVSGQLKQVHAARAQLLKEESGEGQRDAVLAQVKQLMGLCAVGVNSAWVLVMEFFGWRGLRNGREVGALGGLTPTPYNSGGSQREQGISKAGNRRVRALMIELAWQWLRYQPDSDLAQWFQRRFGAGGSRSRRIGIVALARKLLVALWRYLNAGELPGGAKLKAA